MGHVPLKYPSETDLCDSRLLKIGVVIHTCDFSIQETEAGGSQVPGHPGIHIDSLTQNNILPRV